MMSVFTQEQATGMVLNEKYNEGVAYGLERGMQQKAVYIAKNMKEQGLSTDIIVRITGLTKE